MAKKQIIKSADDGRFKSKAFAAAHKKTVYKQMVNVPKKRK